MEEENKLSAGEQALEVVKEKEKALRALIAIGSELQNQSGALSLVDTVASGKKIPITQQAFIAAQEKTKGLSLDDMARYFKGMEQKSAKCLKIICLRTEILDEEDIDGPKVDLAENVSLLKVTQAFRKGAASTQAIQTLISKRNPMAKLQKSDELKVPVEKVRNKLKELKTEASSLRKDATSKAGSIQDDLKKIMNDPTVSEKVREAAKQMSVQVAEVETQLKDRKGIMSTPMIHVEEITLSGDVLEEAMAVPEVEEVEEIVATPAPEIEEKEPEEEPEATEQVIPTRKPKQQPDITEEDEPEKRKGIIGRLISWLMADLTIFKK